MHTGRCFVSPGDLCVCPGDSRGGPATEKIIPGKRMVDKHATGEHTGSPLHRVIQWFKTMTTNEYIRGVKQNGWPSFPGKLWQRNYYEHIIRNENEMARIREYITNNPAQWALDRENPSVKINHIGKLEGHQKTITSTQSPFQDIFPGSRNR
jgi:hypothetical protein